MDILKRKEVSPMKAQRRKSRIEKAKTITLVTIFALSVGFVSGFWAHSTLQAKYSKVPTVQVVQAEAVASVTPVPTSK